MKDQLVSFKVAKLLHEKGFSCMESNCFGDNSAYQLPDGELVSAHKANVVAGYILAPTQSLAMKWLRETKNTIIIPKISMDNQGFTVKVTGYSAEIIVTDADGCFPQKSYVLTAVSFEETIENALINALKHI